MYSPTLILRCFIVRIWFKIDSNNTLHAFLDIDCQYNRKLALACGLLTIPSRRTFDRRLKTISTDVKERISAMGHLFVAAEGFVADPTVTAIDSTLLKAKGHVWHTSSMKKGVVPRSGIDTDARWGYSHTKGWVFGYKLHLTSTTGHLTVPLTADVTTANVQDNQMYVPLTFLLLLVLPVLQYSLYHRYCIWRLIQGMMTGNCTNTAKGSWEWIWFVR